MFWLSVSSCIHLYSFSVLATLLKNYSLLSYHRMIVVLLGPISLLEPLGKSMAPAVVYGITAALPK